MVEASPTTAFLFVFQQAPDLAVRLFLTAVDCSEKILTSRHVERFVYYSAGKQYEAVSPVILRMVKSAIVEVAQSGARQLTLASLGRETLDPLVDRCLTGSTSQRRGAAEVFSTNLVKGPRQERSIAVLTKLFDDENTEVREGARQCFHYIKSVSLERYNSIFNALANSRAIDDDIHFSLRMLAQATSRLPISVLDICERWLDRKDIGERHEMRFRMSEVTALVLRIYAQYREPQVRSRCLDLIDRMLAVEAYGIEEALDSGSR